MVSDVLMSRFKGLGWQVATRLMDHRIIQGAQLKVLAAKLKTMLTVVDMVRIQGPATGAVALAMCGFMCGVELDTSDGEVYSSLIILPL